MSVRSRAYLCGKRCDCGNIGCAELYVNENKFNGSQKEKEEFYSALGSVMVSAVNAFSIRQVVFAGSITEKFDLFTQRLQDELNKRNKKGLRLTRTVLNGKEVFVACNLLMTNSAIQL